MQWRNDIYTKKHILSQNYGSLKWEDEMCEVVFSENIIHSVVCLMTSQ